MAQREKYYLNGDNSTFDWPEPDFGSERQRPSWANDVKNQLYNSGGTSGGAQGSYPSYNSSPWSQKQSDLYEQIASRGPFQYDAKNDPLYGVMRDRYVQQGRMAMKDTMGQAAALTGGYGSSYAQAVGQQQYDAALQGLADVIPELYQTAYQRYADEGNRLMDLYGMAGQEADRDYNRWLDERNWQYQQDQDAYNRQQNTYNQLYSLIMSTGYNPTDDELAAAGMTREQVNALLARYALDNPEPKKSGRPYEEPDEDGSDGDKSLLDKKRKKGQTPTPTPRGGGGKYGPPTQHIN